MARGVCYDSTAFSVLRRASESDEALNQPSAALAEADFSCPRTSRGRGVRARSDLGDLVGAQGEGGG